LVDQPVGAFTGRKMKRSWFSDRSGHLEFVEGKECTDLMEWWGDSAATHMDCLFSE
jgi:hypothetical protein